MFVFAVKLLNFLKTLQEDNSVMTYINDAISQLLIHKNEIAKIDVQEFFYQ